MDDKKVFRCGEREEWRAWLEEHFETESEVWFVFPSKDSGEVGVSYNDAVEEALCFGWIDGRAGTLDKTHQLRRFTPRRPGSPYSQPNIERLILLDKEGKIHPKIRPSIEEIIKTPFVFPEDVLDAIRADGEAWKNYGAFSESYKRIRVAYIDAARRRPAEFEKRLANFIKKTRENKLIVGYGGVDKYYVNGADPGVEIKLMETDAEICGKAYVHFKSWHESYSDIVDADYLKNKVTLEKCEAMAKRFPDNVLIAKDGERVVGFAAYGKYRDESFSGGEIYAIYVLEEYQKRKIGYSLMKAALEELAEYDRVALLVFKDNKKAIDFYEKVGFRPDGTENVFTLGTELTEIRMVLEKRL